MNSRDAIALTLPPDDPRHGTKNGYANLGCRCDRCRTEWREYTRRRRGGLVPPRLTPEPGRFYVTSLSGFGGEGGNDDHYATCYQVLDTFYCRRLMFESFTRSAAERVARELNEGRITYVNALRRRRGLPRLVAV